MQRKLRFSSAFDAARRRRSPRAVPGRCGADGHGALLGALAIAGAGSANGMLIGVFTAGVREFAGGIVVGALFGALCSLPFIPALGLILAAARRVGRARAPSVVDSLDRRRVWLVPDGAAPVGRVPRRRPRPATSRCRRRSPAWVQFP